MAVELATGYVSIVPSGRGFGRSLVRDARLAGSNAGDAASSSFGSRFVGSMGRIARRAGLALGAGLGAAGIFGVKVAADFEQTRIAFEGILGDVEKANSLLEDLRDFAAKTPFNFTGLADSARQLLAVGFEADEIIPTMTTLGNVAATLGVGEQEIAGVVRALGQMRGKGKASAEELQQISEQIPGFSAITVIAEDMGIATAEAFDLMAKGAIPADDAIESILAGMETFPGAAGAMDRQSKTLNGVLSTLKDNLEGMAIDFITPYLPTLASGVTVLSGWLENTLVPALQSVASWLGDSVVPAVKSFTEDALAGLSDWWGAHGEDVIGFFSALKDVLGDIVTAAAPLVGGAFQWLVDTAFPAVITFGTWLLENEAAMVGVVTAIGVAFGLWAANATAAAISSVIAAAPFYLLLAAVALLAAGLYWLWENNETFRLGVLLTIDAFKSWIGFIGDVIDAIEKLVGWLGDALALALDLKDAAGGFLGGNGSGFNPLNPLDWLTQGPAGPLKWVFGEFADGGVVGGAFGAPQFALVHGGETIRNPMQEAALAASAGPLIGSVTVQQYPGEDAAGALWRQVRHVQRTKQEMATK